VRGLADDVDEVLSGTCEGGCPEGCNGRGNDRQTRRRR